MTDRTISVRLQALVGPYSASIAKAKRDTQEFKTELTQTAQKGGEFTKTLGTGLLVAGGVMAAGFGKAIGAAAEFDRAMSEVGAVANATSGEMDTLRKAAIDAGAATAFSATEAATAQAELVKAGISVSDVLGGALDGALDLAAAGSLDLAQASEIAAQAMNIFKLRGDDVTHIADLLAAGANKSAADVGQLGDALRQGGLVASQTGLTIEETTAALAAFADNALVGSDAGTSLKTMLQRLTPQSTEAASMMEQLGFSAYDAQGNFIGLEALAGELQTSLGGLSVEQRNMAMSTLFGSDAVRAANVLYEEGAEGIADYVTAVNDQGAAADMAAEKLDNLSGDIEALTGSLETQLIEGGSKATGMLRGMAQGATDLLNGFGEMPDLLQTGGLLMGGLGTATAIASGAFLTLSPRIAAANAQLATMAANSPRAAAGIAAAGTAAGLFAAALPGIGAAMILMGNVEEQGNKTLTGFVESLPTAKTADEFASNIDRMIGKYEGLKRTADGASAITKPLQEAGQLLDFTEDNTIADAEAATRAFSNAINSMLPELERWREAEDEIMAKTGLTAVQVNDLAAQLGVDLSAAGEDGAAAIEAVVAAAGELDSGVPATERQQQSLEELQAAAEVLLERLSELGDASGGFTDAFAAYDTVYARAEENARAHAEELADIENEGIDDRVQALRDGASDTAAALQADAEAHISAAGLTGEAADEVRRAADDKAKAVRRGADDEIEALNDGKVSWEDYVEEVKVSTADLIAEWEAQIAAQANWRANLVRITVRGRRDVADELAKMGPEGAALVQQFANMTDAEFDKAADLFITSATDGGAGVGAALDQQLAVAEAIGKAGAQDTAASIARELGVLPSVVELIAFSMGVTLAQGLKAMDRQMADWYAGWGATPGGIRISTDGGGGIPLHAANGGLVPEYRADGGPIFKPRGTDTVPAMLTPGEFVMSRGATAALGAPLLAAMNRTRAPMSFGGGGGNSYDQSRSAVFHVNYPKPEPMSGLVPRLQRKALAAVMGG